MNGVDRFGSLYGSRSRQESVRSPFPSHSRILSLLSPKNWAPSPSIPDQVGLQRPSRSKTIISRVREVLSRRPKLLELLERLLRMLHLSPEQGVKQQELPSKPPYNGMPSDRLVVIQILSQNYYQPDSGSNPSPLRGRFKILWGSLKIAFLSILEHLKLKKKNPDFNGSTTLDESQDQALEATNASIEPGEVAAENKSTAFDETTGGNRAADSEGYGKACSDSSGVEALSKKEDTSHRIEPINTANESEEDGKVCDNTSKPDELSTKENTAQEIEDGAIAHINEGKKEGFSDYLVSDALSEKEKVTANDPMGREEHCRGRSADNAPQIEDSDTANDSEGDGEDCRNPSSFDGLSERSSDESDGGVALHNRKEESEGCSNPSTSDNLSKENTGHKIDGANAGEGCEVEKKETSGCSGPEDIPAVESIHIEDRSDEVGVDAGANRVVDEDSGALPSEQYRGWDAEIEVAADGPDEVSVDTGSEKENHSSGNRPFSSVSIETKKRALI